MSLTALAQARAARAAEQTKRREALKIEMKEQPSTPLETISVRQIKPANHTPPRQPSNPAAEAASVKEVMDQITIEEIDQARAALDTLPDDSPARATIARLLRGAQVYINRHRASQEALF